MRGAFASAGVDMSDDACAGAFGSMRRRCFGPHRSLLVGSDGPCGNHLRGSRGALEVGVEVLTDPTSHDVSSTPQRQRRPPRGCGCLTLSRHPRLKTCSRCRCFRFVRRFCPPSPEVSLRRAEKTKFAKYSEGVRSRPDVRFIPFVFMEFGTQRPRHGFLDGASQGGRRL
jgi:hypothetical protein